MPSEPLAVRFPEAWPNQSFVLEIGDLQSDIDLDIELAVPQPNEKTEAIVHTMAMSLLATHRGAYADDIFDPSNSIVYLGPDVMDVSPNHIVWFIEVLRCNELALDGAHQPPRGCASANCPDPARRVRPVGLASSFQALRRRPVGADGDFTSRNFRTAVEGGRWIAVRNRVYPRHPPWVISDAREAIEYRCFPNRCVCVYIFPRVSAPTSPSSAAPGLSTD